MKIMDFSDLLASEESKKWLSTGDPVLDDCLGGGLPWQHIIQIVGEAGSGKSQFAMQLGASIRLTHPQIKCFFIGPKHRQSLITSRFLEILRFRGAPSASTDADLLDNVFVRPIFCIRDFLTSLEDLRAIDDVGLVCIDGLEAFIGDFDNDAAKRTTLYRIAASAIGLVLSHPLCVVVFVNEVRYDMIRRRLVPALGPRWSNYFPVRLWISLAGRNPKKISFRVEKTPLKASGRVVDCWLDAGGLRPVQ